MKLSTKLKRISQHITEQADRALAMENTLASLQESNASILKAMDLLKKEKSFDDKALLHGYKSDLEMAIDQIQNQKQLIIDLQSQIKQQ